MVGGTGGVKPGTRWRRDGCTLPVCAAAGCV